MPEVVMPEALVRDAVRVWVAVSVVLAVLGVVLAAIIWWPGVTHDPE